MNRTTFKLFIQRVKLIRPIDNDSLFDGVINRRILLLINNTGVYVLNLCRIQFLDT